MNLQQKLESLSDEQKEELSNDLISGWLSKDVLPSVVEIGVYSDVEILDIYKKGLGIDWAYDEAMKIIDNVFFGAYSYDTTRT
jgi:hypothetical protein